jgi:hypothetical protein
MPGWQSDPSLLITVDEVLSQLRLRGVEVEAPEHQVAV